MFVIAFGDLSVSRAMVFDGIVALWRVRSQLKMQSGAEGWNNENIAGVATVLKDDHCDSCMVIAESTGYQKSTFIVFCLMI